MKKEMLFGISFYFAACARSAGIRFAGMCCRGTHFADAAGACTGYDRIVLWPRRLGGDSFRRRALPRDAFCGDLQMLRARVPDTTALCCGRAV